MGKAKNNNLRIKVDIRQDDETIPSESWEALWRLLLQKAENTNAD
jgi:hypothetical protein